MKRINRGVFLITLIISSFLFINNVQADYKASAINPSGASCSLYSGSTGYCYYKDKNLNSYVNHVIWLDSGDEVTVLTDYATVASPNTNLCSDYYVYTSYYSAYYNSTYNGYYCHANLSTGEVSDELKEEFKSAGFPESYWSKLAILKQAHPNWTFKAINTGLNFNDAVEGENNTKSLIQGSSSNNYAYLALDYGAFNYYTDSYTAYDNTSASWNSRWFRANYDTIAYYMDPRNFLIDMYIFQFEGLSYDNSISDENLKNIVNTAFNGDYLANFTDVFITAGKESKVNPIYLAALSKQEVGNGETPGTAISGTYNGMYNFYNIGATGGSNPVYNGLSFAANTDSSTLRPWNTEYKAIVGGALWMAQKYISVGQDTSYFKKFNVVYNYLISTGKVSNPYDNYTHQYMTNIAAVSSEAMTTYKSYYKDNLLDLSFIFYIPVYNSMPDSTSLPTKTGWPNNYLSSISLNGVNIADFDGGVETYNYYLNINNPTITIDAKAVSSSASISGNGTFTIDKDTTKNITVTAQNGDVKTYKINITLTGTKLEEPIDVVTTLNNAGIKNGDKYISGLTVESDISVIKNKIINANSNAVVYLKNSSGKDKSSGLVSTGDQVTITVGEETKTYEIVIYGDANGDGKISAVDYVKIKNNIMGTSTLSEVYKEAADVDKNGKISAVDYVKIKNMIMGNGTISQ